MPWDTPGRSGVQIFGPFQCFDVPCLSRLPASSFPALTSPGPSWYRGPPTCPRRTGPTFIGSDWVLPVLRPRDGSLHSPSTSVTLRALSSMGGVALSCISCCCCTSYLRSCSLGPVPSPLCSHRGGVMVLLLFLGHFWSCVVPRRHADRLPTPIETVCFALCLERVFWLVSSSLRACGRLVLMGGDVTRVRVTSAALCRVAPTMMTAAFLARTLRRWPRCSRSSVTSPVLPICLPLHRLSCFGHCLIRVLWLACRLPLADLLPAPS